MVFALLEIAISTFCTTPTLASDNVCCTSVYCTRVKKLRTQSSPFHQVAIGEPYLPCLSDVIGSELELVDVGRTEKPEGTLVHLLPQLEIQREAASFVKRKKKRNSGLCGSSYGCHGILDARTFQAVERGRISDPTS